MKIILLFLGCFMCHYLMVQDGSNIRYYDPASIDSTFIGKYCHIDFGHISFGGLVVDTIEINVKGQKLKFYEHRDDDGFNNWFERQYLILAKDMEGVSTRLIYSQIDSLTDSKIYVTSVVGYYVNESPVDTITVFQHWYDRNNVSKVLIRD